MAGLFFLPVGVLAGPFLGAFAGELIARKGVGHAALGGLGAFLGFLCGLLAKLAVCAAMATCLARCLFG